jgi:hypothetical protein
MGITPCSNSIIAISMGSPLPISINTGAPKEIWSALAPIILARSYRVNLVSLTCVTSKQIPESLINALFIYSSYLNTKYFFPRVPLRVVHVLFILPYPEKMGLLRFELKSRRPERHRMDQATLQPLLTGTVQAGPPALHESAAFACSSIVRFRDRRVLYLRLQFRFVF